MKTKRWMPIFLLVMVLLLTGCGSAARPDAVMPSDAGTASEEPAPPTSKPEEPYAFKAHLYSPLLSKYYSKAWWDSLYHLCDALWEGRDTFACASQEIYDWCMDEVTLTHMFPAACMAVTGKSNDGTVPFENGIGRVYYNIPPEEFAARQAEFETLIEALSTAFWSRTIRSLKKVSSSMPTWQRISPTATSRSTERALPIRL